MSVVALEYRKTKSEMDDILRNVGDSVTPEILLMLDFAYHNTEPTYEDGLSFLDRLHAKLSMYHEIQWNVQHLKAWVRNSQNPQVAFVDILNELLTDSMIASYGV
jgi:hypothetical protein